jgi:hypothetical protein
MESLFEILVDKYWWYTSIPESLCDELRACVDHPDLETLLEAHAWSTEPLDLLSDVAELLKLEL